MGDANKSPRVQVPRVNRHADWLTEYIDGSTMHAIAERHGVAKSTVHEAIHRQLRESRDRRNTLADVALDLQIARYTDLYRRCIEELDDTENGREVGKAQLIAAARGALDSLTKILGLDQPTTITVHTETALDREMRHLTDLMRDQLELPAPPTDP